MKKKAPDPKISTEQLRQIYAEGEDAVVEMFQLCLKRIESLEKQIEELKEKANKNSRNSSKPPSSDGFKKKTKSLRGKSGKKSGGQKGHPGQTLEWSEGEREFCLHEVKECVECGASLSGEPVRQKRGRQVFELPAIKLAVTEHQVEVKDCPHCGKENQGEFPAEAKNLVQYGARMRALMVYLMDGQLLPSGRAVEMLKDIFDVKISEGTLHSVRKECSQELEEIEESIRQGLRESPMVNFDETGMRIAGKSSWLHVASTENLTSYYAHRKRGQEAMNEAGILPQFSGKAIHDGNRSYNGYDCEHFLCNAHHLRELAFVWEQKQQNWAYQMSLLLVSIHSEIKREKERGQGELTPEHLRNYAERYEEILREGLGLNPRAERPPDGQKKRGRVKQSTTRNLLERLRDKKEGVLGFMYDFTVPFDNNQAERDLRMMKLKQKISGCFRTEEGAKIFTRIRGYLSTLRKQGHQLLDSLIGLFLGNPPTLTLQPE